MALLKRDLYHEDTDADRCTLVFDTDSKRLYVELEMAHRDSTVGGTVDCRIATMDIADYLEQDRQTAGHRELRQLLGTPFKANRDGTEFTDETSSAATAYSKLRIWENCYSNGHVF
jgi:hypothetical protein